MADILVVMRVVVVVLPMMFAGGARATSLMPGGQKNFCKYLGERVEWIYRQRNGGEEYSATVRGIETVSISKFVDKRVMLLKGTRLNEGVRYLLISIAGDVYSYPKNAFNPKVARQEFVSGCMERPIDGD